MKLISDKHLNDLISLNVDPAIKNKDEEVKKAYQKGFVDGISTAADSALNTCRARLGVKSQVTEIFEAVVVICRDIKQMYMENIK